MDAQKITSIDGLETLFQHGNLFFASQPSAEALKTLTKQGLKQVVNIRMPSEGPFDDELEACSNLGIEYHHLPVYESGKWNVVHLHNLNELIQNNPDQKILIHCQSANRAGAWYALYLMKSQNLSLDEALKTSKECGLTKKELEISVSEFSELYF